MDLTSTGLAAFPATVVAAAVLGRMLAPLAREVRLIVVGWLALRGTQPNERPEILRALAAVPYQAGQATISKVDSIKVAGQHGHRRPV